MAELMNSDPRTSVAEFVSSPYVRNLAGNTEEGLVSLMEIVESEIRKQNPDSGVMILGKEEMEENRVFTRGDLGKYVETLDWSGVKYLIFRNDICVVNWGDAFAFLKGKGIDVYMGGFMGRGIPVCNKLIAPFDKF